MAESKEELKSLLMKVKNNWNAQAKKKIFLKILILRLKFFSSSFFPFFRVPRFVCVEQSVVIMNGGREEEPHEKKRWKRKKIYHITIHPM